MIRTIILHMHMFKNAGTTFDYILEKNFPYNFYCFDNLNDPNTVLNAKDLMEFIRLHPDALAISSHQIRFPFPQIEGYRILPAVFIREPLDRAFSVYNYFRRIDEESEWSKLAKSNTIDEFISICLNSPSALIRNYQTAFIGRDDNLADAEESHLSIAYQRLENIPLLGIVERFDDSLQLFASIFKMHYPDRHFDLSYVSQNVSPEKFTVKDSAVMIELYKNNWLDLQLYDKTVKEFESRLIPTVSVEKHN